MPHDPKLLPTDLDELRETACMCAEEFARIGHEGPAILRMFQNPFYASAHRTYRALGHVATSAIIDACLARGRSRVAPAAAAVGTATRRSGSPGRNV